MERKKVVYAVLKDLEDLDHGEGSTVKREAIRMVKALRKEGYKDAYIAIVDPKDDFCLDEIHDF